MTKYGFIWTKNLPKTQFLAKDGVFEHISSRQDNPYNYNIMFSCDYRDLTLYIFLDFYIYIFCDFYVLIF